MEVDSVQVNILAHGQHVPGHSFSLVHGKTLEVGIELSINGCKKNKNSYISNFDFWLPLP